MFISVQNYKNFIQLSDSSPGIEKKQDHRSGSAVRVMDSKDGRAVDLTSIID